MRAYLGKHPQQQIFELLRNLRGLGKPERLVLDYLQKCTWFQNVQASKGASLAAFEC